MNYLILNKPFIIFIDTLFESDLSSFCSQSFDYLNLSYVHFLNWLGVTESLFLFYLFPLST